MNTALAGVPRMTDSPPHRADRSTFPAAANVLSLQARRDQFPIVIRGQGMIDVLPPCGKAGAYYVVEDARGRKGIMDFSNYESMRPRMYEIKNG